MLKGYNSSTDAHAFTHIHTHTRTYTHTYAHTRSHSRIHAHTHTRTHTHKYTHAHIHTNTHTNTLTTHTQTLQVLELLPEDVPLGHVMPWLGSALGHCTEQSRNMAVVKHLRR